MEKLNQDFLEFIQLLEKHHVKYIVVGGYAVGFHGFPRYTGDIDFFIEISEQNADRVFEVFNEFGFGEIGITVDDFLKESFVVEIGREPRKIQVLTGIDGVKFQDCYNDRVEVTYHGYMIKFIDLKKLIQNKKATARPKDLIDLIELTKLAAETDS